MPHFAIDVEAELTLLPTEHGGRTAAAHSGYRPQFYYDGHDWDAVHTYPDQPELAPGATARVHLSFLNPREHVGKLHTGKAFLIREGQRIVGYGSVTRVVELEESARRAG